MAGLATINVKFQVDLKQFSTGMQNSLREIDKFGQKMQKVGRGMTTYFTAPILAAGVAATKMASDYAESVNKVDVAFDSSSESVKKFAKTSLESFGIAESTALDMAAAYGDMGTSMGLSTAEAAKMSTELVGLAGDLASFKNIGIDQANTALSAIFTGETESLKKLGIVMTEANLQQFALSKGIKTQIKDMDQASKVNLRYAYIMSVTTNSQGDFARTGGGAANQSRIFMESLKQLGQQFGQVILPYFTKFITSINGMVKGLMGLSEGTKTTVLVVAGLVAVAGPLLMVIGSIAAGIPPLVVGFTALRTSFAALTATMMTNPLTALALVATAAATAIILLNTNTEKAVTSQTALNEAIKKGNENAAAEVGTLDKLYASATNVKLETKERKKAVDEMQALYPAYFGNLKDEIILNGKAETSYKNLREAIFNKSRAIAIDNELQQRANSRVKEEMELQEKLATTREKIKQISEGSNKIILQEASLSRGTLEVSVSKTKALEHQYALLKAQKIELENFYSTSKKSDEALFRAKEEYLKKTGKLEENEALKLNDIKVGTDAIKDSIEALKPGTIAFYEKQIQDLEKIQKETSTTAAYYNALGNEIEKIQEKINRISPNNDLVSELNPAGFTKGNDPKALPKADVDIKAPGQIDELTAKMLYLKEVGQEVGTSVADAFSGMSNRLVESLGLANDGFGGFIAGLVQTVTKLIAMMLSAAISQSIAGATASGTATGPAAIFTTPAFIATAVGGVLAAFAAIPKFELGGIVGGTSYYGDKIMARVNSQEMISNTDQQRKIWGAMNSGSNVNVSVNGEWVLDGNKLRLVLDRTDKRNSRIG